MLKKNLIIIGLVLFAKVSIAQDFQYSFIGAGYNYCIYPKHLRLDGFIDEFNKKNPWLDTKMPHLNDMEGFNFYAGLIQERFYYDIDFVGRHKTLSADSFDHANNHHVKQDLKIRANTLNFAFGVSIRNYVIPGFSFEMGSVSALVRNYNSNSATPSFTRAGSPEFQVGMTAFVKIMVPVLKKQKLKLCIKPYYQLMIFPSKYGTLEDHLYPNGLLQYSQNFDHLKNYGAEMSLQFGWGLKQRNGWKN